MMFRGNENFPTTRDACQQVRQTRGSHGLCSLRRSDRILDPGRIESSGCRLLDRRHCRQPVRVVEKLSGSRSRYASSLPAYDIVQNAEAVLRVFGQFNLFDAEVRSLHLPRLQRRDSEAASAPREASRRTDRAHRRQFESQPEVDRWAKPRPTECRTSRGWMIGGSRRCNIRLPRSP